MGKLQNKILKTVFPGGIFYSNQSTNNLRDRYYGKEKVRTKNINWAVGTGLLELATVYGGIELALNPNIPLYAKILGEAGILLARYVGASMESKRGSETFSNLKPKSS